MSTYDLLDKHLWNERVLLIFANDLKNEDLKSQWQNRQQDPQGYRERDLKTYLILTEEVLDENRWSVSEKGAADLRLRFGVRPDEFRAILITKDGSQKLNESFPVSNQRLFTIIDELPMRKREME